MKPCRSCCTTSVVVNRKCLYAVEQLEAEQAQRGLWFGSLVPPWEWRQVDSRFKCDTENDGQIPPKESGRRGICGAWC
jgi:hypothetical protein